MSYQGVAEFVTLELRIILIFGASFLLPMAVMALNLLNVVRGHQLKKWRRGVFFGSFVLATVATPSADPFTMFYMAVPMTLLFYLSEMVCYGLDGCKGIVTAGEGQFNIDVDDDKWTNWRGHVC